MSDDALSDDPNELAAQRHEGLVDDARWQALLARHGVPLERAAAEHAAIAEALGDLPRPATRPGGAAAIIAALPRPTSVHARRRALWWAPLLAAAACLAVAGMLLMVEGGPEREASRVAYAQPAASPPSAGWAVRVARAGLILRQWSLCRRSSAAHHGARRDQRHGRHCGQRRGRAADAQARIRWRSGQSVRAGAQAVARSAC